MRKGIFFGIFLMLFCVFLGSPIFAADKSINITFGWKQEVSADFAGWKLYSSPTSGGPYTLLATIPFATQMAAYTASQAINAPVGSDTALFFVLSSYDVNGNESGYSNEIAFRADLLPPKEPTDFKISVYVVVTTPGGL